MQENIPQSPTIIYAIIVIVTALVTALVNFLIKKNDNRTSKEIAEINLDKKEFDALKIKLHKALDSIKELNITLEKEKESRNEIEQKFNAVKIAYRIIFKQYARQFKDDPESLFMLEELNHIINK